MNFGFVPYQDQIKMCNFFEVVLNRSEEYFQTTSQLAEPKHPLDNFSDGSKKMVGIQFSDFFK